MPTVVGACVAAAVVGWGAWVVTITAAVVVCCGAWVVTTAMVVGEAVVTGIGVVVSISEINEQ